MELTDIKAPEPVTGRPPWLDPDWLAAADDWISAACAHAGLERAGTAQARCRSYSVVARVPVRDAAVWFKASPPAARFEAALITALADWYPGQFTAPVAVDLDRGWSLTRDGGPTLRQRLTQPGDLGGWEPMLRGYATLQAGLAAKTGRLLELGLADLRPDRVPGQFARLLASPGNERAAAVPDGIGRDRLAALLALAPQVSEWCAELAELGIPASLDHADVHPNNIFAASGVPFDWGDSAVAHPFSSLWVTRMTAAEQASLPPGAPAVDALTEVYLEPWLAAGYPHQAAVRSVALALRIAPLTRALAWGRVWPCYQGHPVPARNALRSLAVMLDRAGG